LAEYHNPQQQPGIEKRMLLFGAIVIVILLITDLFYRPQKPTAPPQPGGTQTAGAPASATTPAPATGGAKAAEAPSESKRASAESETVIENELYRITFTNHGAQVKSWILKKYTDDHKNPLELVNTIATAKVGYPLSLWTYDPALRTKLSEALYLTDVQGGTRRENVYAAPATISFEYSDQQTTVRKRIKFDHSYVIELETSVTNNGSTVQAYPAWPGGFGDQTIPASYAAAHLVLQRPDKIERFDVKKVSGGNTLNGPFHWAGSTDQYFAALFLPSSADTAAMVTLHETIAVPRNRNKPESKETDLVPVLGAAVGDKAGTTREQLFVGPKALDVLSSVRAETGANLSGAIDFGFFGTFARWLFLWLKWTHDHMRANWGWAIVILTIVINAALLPLRIASMKTSLKMQRLQPQMDEIKKKYEKYTLRDPRRQEMNKEIWELQRREGVNMLGGCLPMLLQLPFLWAFYNMLSTAIELRHAGWFWIRDLSSPDPYHLLPLATIVTMMFLQHITPQAGMDPMQRRMMNVMMPVMFGFFTWTVASGLALYWTIGNVVFVTQQYFMNRTKLAREIYALQEKRARKKAGK
jgi:YidC/Oxa1 family membrane protein insertase